MTNKLVLAIVLLFSGACAHASTFEVPGGVTPLTLYGEVRAENSGALADAIIKATDAGETEQWMFIDSPGGSVYAGLQVVQAMRLAQARGVTFHCLGTGLVASMAYYVFSECDERVALPNTSLLWHPVKIGVRSMVSAADAHDMLVDLRHLEAQLLDRLRVRMGAKQSWFMLHYRLETAHLGAQLVLDVPEFLTIADGVDGVPLVSIFAPPVPSFGFDGTTSDDNDRIIWEYTRAQQLSH
jgi:ATP-dependent protease ClpP protease subunit